MAARIVLQPRVYAGIQRGVSQIADAIRPTLGPVPRMVAVSHIDGNQIPELLDNGALIARQIIALPERNADIGAMFMRHLLWQLYQDVGDGTATAGVLFESVFNQGIQHIASGGSATRLRGFLEQAQREIQAEITAQAQPVGDPDELIAIAETSCQDHALACALGNIFNTLGAYGSLRIVEGNRRDLETEYVEGMHWAGGLLAGKLLTGQTLELEQPAVLLSDLSIQNPRDLIPLLQQANRAGIRKVVIVAAGISEAVMAMLASVSKSPDVFQVVPIKTPGATALEQSEGLADLAIVTGAQPIFKATGEVLENIALARLGRVQHVWVNRTHFGIIDDDPAAEERREQQRLKLHAAAERATDAPYRARLEQRIGSLLNASANLWIGGLTAADIESRKGLANRAAAAVRGAIHAGIVLGGGTALFACQDLLKRRWRATSDEDERAAYRILTNAVEVPLRTLSANAGHDPASVIARLKAQPDAAFDAQTGAIVPLSDYAIRDPAHVVEAALRVAILGAAQALTIDVIVHHKQPIAVTEP